MRARREAQLWAAALFIVATAVGVGAWFLPPTAGVVAALAAAAVAVVGLSLANDGFRHFTETAFRAVVRIFPLILGSVLVFALLRWAWVAGRWERWLAAAVLALVVVYAALRTISGGADLKAALPGSPGLDEQIAGEVEGLTEGVAGTLSRERVPVSRRLAELAYLARENVSAIHEVQGQNAELHKRIDQLLEDLAEAERLNRRSNWLMFVGGVALSIPIGFLVNLATG
ncbi:hypothetical protein [Actinoplanes sp. NPDC049599]|uniref:hypothetical protein n=1 Tax=Actinoplanes sp. NPDC049599 TaxID=3363903 RepID=UPI0037A7F97B